jgi:hypothetical protein
MNDRGAIPHTRQNSPHEGVRRQQQMVRLLGASRSTEIMQGVLSFAS